MEEKLDMEHRMTQVEGRCKSNTHRLDKLEEEQGVIHELATSIKVMAGEQKHQTEAIRSVKEQVENLDGKVDALEAKPGKKWEEASKSVLLAVIAAVVAFFMGKFGL